jgi:hypothetical protein
MTKVILGAAATVVALGLYEFFKAPSTTTPTNTHVPISLPVVINPIASQNQHISKPLPIIETGNQGFTPPVINRIGAYSLTCECANGTRCKSAAGDCSCCGAAGRKAVFTKRNVMIG